MKKTLSLFLSLIMLVSAFAMPSGAQAATPNMLTVSVSGTIVDSIVKPAIDEINTYRTEKSIGSKLTLDKTLTEQARVRATEIMFRGKASDSVKAFPTAAIFTAVSPNTELPFTAISAPFRQPLLTSFRFILTAF